MDGYGLLILIMVLTGGFIGYITNSLALYSLFHPREPWYVFGVKVPLTPGLIPSRQDDLARAIRGVLEDEVVTRTQIRGRIDEAIQDWMDENEGRLGPLRKFFEPLEDRVRGRLSDRLASLIQKHVAAGDIAEEHLRQVDLKRLEQLIHRVARNEFKYIRWLGGLLGGLIGAVQGMIVLVYTGM